MFESHTPYKSAQIWKHESAVLYTIMYSMTQGNKIKMQILYSAHHNARYVCNHRIKPSGL